MKKISFDKMSRSTQIFYKTGLMMASAVLITSLPYSRVLLAKAVDGGDGSPGGDADDDRDDNPTSDTGDGETGTLEGQLEGVKPTIVDTDRSGTEVLIHVAARVINIILLIAGILAVIYLVWAGVVYITAGGDTAKADKGRVGIVNALIGLVVIAAAFLLIRFVTGSVNGLGNDDTSDVPVF